MARELTTAGEAKAKARAKSRGKSFAPRHTHSLGK